MFLRRSLRLVLAALLLLCAVPLKADMAKAAALYKSGAAKQAAKDYSGAIADFSASLAAEPRYVFSLRERGTCKYYLGDKAGALADYSAYSKANPKDLKTASLVRRLQAAQGTAPAAPAAPMAAAAAAATERPKWGLALGGGYNTYSFKDWNDWNTGPGANAAYNIGSGLGMGLGLNFRVTPAIMMGLDLDYLMAGYSVSTSTAFGKSEDSASFPLMLFSLSGAYVIPFNKLDLRLGAGLGYGLLSGSQTSKFTPTVGAGSTSTSTVSGSGLGFKLFAGLDYYFGRHFSLGLDLGYRLASVSPVTYAGSTGGSGTFKKKPAATATSLENGSFDYSGVLVKLGLNYWF